MSAAKHVVVIGAGVIGVCSAYYLVRRGFRVTVVDRGDADYEGCSFGNAGMIVPSHFVPLAAPGMVALGLKWMWNPESPFWVKPRLSPELWAWGWKFWRAANPRKVAEAAPLLRDLHFVSRAAFEELSTTGDFRLVTKGLLMLCQTEHTLDEEAKAAEWARQLGVPAEVLDARGAAKLEPNLRMKVAGAVYFPKDGHLSPDRFMHSMRERLAKSGVEFCWNSEVTEFQRSGDRIDAIMTTRGTLRAGEYVLCGGSWSSPIARQLRLKLPMQAGKGYSVTLPKPRLLPELCAILTEARVAVTPMGERLRFGGTMEIAGLNEHINPVRVQGIIKSASNYYPDLRADDFAGVKPWCGLRPCSPDGLPYLGRPARYSNLTIATGHAMMGLSLGPVTGQLVADLVSNARPSIDISQLDPDRYSR
jgi:D-amino-acid dehydrogenase